MTVVHRQDVVLLERLGGRDADVHRAIVRTSGRVVVAKHTTWDRPLVSDRLDRAASILQRIQQPGLARLVARIDDDHGRCLLLAYEAGGSLGDLVASGRTCTSDEVAAIGGRIAGALAALHEAGVVHRDVHPGNVLLDARLGAVLVDLDNALDDMSPPLPGDHDVVGHPDHVDHRVLAGQSAGPASDLHGLATTLWTAATGLVPPRDGPDGPITLPTDADVPEALRGVLAACLDGTIPDAGTAATRLRTLADDLAGRSGAPDADAPAQESSGVLHASAARPATAPGTRGEREADIADHTHRWGVPAPDTRAAPIGTATPDARPAALQRRVVVATVSLVALLGLSLAATTKDSRSTLVAPPPPCDAADALPGQEALADLDGDGCAEALSLLDGELSTPDGRFMVGTAGDVLVAGDWDGDGRWGIGLYRPTTGEVFLIDDPGPGATSRHATLHAVGGTPVVVQGPDVHEVRVDPP